MAITKQQKKELIEQYEEWINKSQGLIVTEYIGLSMNDMDDLRKRVREAGGEYHILKNTLAKIAFDNVKLQYNPENFIKTTAVGFAFEDPPALAKAMMGFAKESDFLKVKCGYLNGELISPAEVKALADLPPLPVLRAHLLRTILAPATQLARILSEPGRQIAAVIKAYSEKDTASEAT
ncbi:MAG: 50S ribosomal protein L10 [Anaerolineales bacterium]|nr:50S ribosomal protein L10 [Anaerolineales bacterium]